MKPWLLLGGLPLILSSFQLAYDPLPPPSYAVIAPAVSTVSLAPPLQKLRETDHYGYRIDPISSEVEFHRGLDLNAEEGTEVFAVLGGVVKKAGYHKTYGNYLRIDHYNGFESLYAHCQKLLVKEGERVEKGECIALSGNTGRVTGPHLHLELQADGKLLDPRYFWEIP